MRIFFFLIEKDRINAIGEKAQSSLDGFKYVIDFDETLFWDNIDHTEIESTARRFLFSYFSSISKVIMEVCRIIEFL